MERALQCGGTCSAAPRRSSFYPELVAGGAVVSGGPYGCTAACSDNPLVADTYGTRDAPAPYRGGYDEHTSKTACDPNADPDCVNDWTNTADFYEPYYSARFFGIVRE